MKYGIVSDTHQGARGGSRVFREYMAWWWEHKFFPHMKENGITTVLHGGDLFDNRNSINLHDIDFMVNTFCRLVKDYGIHMYIIAGNHDVAYRNTNRIHALSMVKMAAPDNITLIEDDVMDVGPFSMVPWINNENHDKIMKQIKERAGPDRILLGHFEINGMKMYANSIKCEGGLSPSIFKDFKKVLSGHFHHPNVHQNIEYIGSPFELTWQDYGDWRGHMIYDEADDSYTRILNEHQLFNAFAYEDMKGKDDDELKQAVEGQFVVMSINEDEKKVKLKDFIAKLETFHPLQIDITDNTVVVTSFQRDDVQQEQIKDTKQYIHRYVEERDDEYKKDKVLPILDSLYSEAMDNMKDSE